jgi:serine/threonine protein kinase
MPSTGPAGISELQLRQACAELDRRLRAGESCRAEHFFAQAPLLASREDWAVELIYTEFVSREELGLRPTPEEFYARFGCWKARLCRQFQVHELVRDSLAVVPTPAPDSGPRPGDRLGPYELLEEVARGGCGIVYRAWQDGLERVVALKALRPEVAALPTARQRFCDEARVMAALRHRHIMPIHDIGESRGVIYFSMDWAPRSLVGRRPTPAEAARLLERVARAVHHAHEQGVIHRDLKPSNILLDEGGEPLVSDFGLACRPLTEAAAGDLGGLAGTPAYMAPEQVDGRGRSLGPATDVWALGVILYELLTGHRPFGGESLLQLQEAICTGQPAPLDGSEGHSDPRLEAICRRCLAVDAAQRFPSAAVMAAALNSCLHS